MRQALGDSLEREPRRCGFGVLVPFQSLLKEAGREKGILRQCVPDRRKGNDEEHRILERLGERSGFQRVGERPEAFSRTRQRDDQFLPLLRVADELDASGLGEVEVRQLLAFAKDDLLPVNAVARARGQKLFELVGGQDAEEWDFGQGSLGIDFRAPPEKSGTAFTTSYKRRHKTTLPILPTHRL